MVDDRGQSRMRLVHFVGHGGGAKGGPVRVFAKRKALTQGCHMAVSSCDSPGVIDNSGNVVMVCVEALEDITMAPRVPQKSPTAPDTLTLNGGLGVPADHSTAWARTPWPQDSSATAARKSLTGPKRAGAMSLCDTKWRPAFCRAQENRTSFLSFHKP
jgi:hypothetical protein